MRITKSRILKLNPCGRAVIEYDAQIKRGWDSWIDLLKDKSISQDDRIWVGIRALKTQQQKVLFACWCAEFAFKQVDKDKVDPRSKNAIKVAKAWANGDATKIEVDAAWSAAESARSGRSAAWSAESARSAAESAWSAAWSARSAAWSARSAAESARSAAESAAESARSAAWSAAWSARNAAKDKEIARLIRMLQKQEGK